MRFDVTKLTYREIENAIAELKRTPCYISKLGSNVLITIDDARVG